MDYQFNNSNTTFVKVKSGITKKGMIHFHIDSNTTFVKVKLSRN